MQIHEVNGAVVPLSRQRLRDTRPPDKRWYPVPIDGISLVSLLNSSLDLSQSVRSELWIADDVLREGNFKLITGKGTGPSTCMVGIGGRPVPVANDPTNLSTTCGTGHCTGNETDPADTLICSGCKCPDYKPGPDCTPCLFNLAEDPGAGSIASYLYMPIYR